MFLALTRYHALACRRSMLCITQQIARVNVGAEGDKRLRARMQLFLSQLHSEATVRNVDAYYVTIIHHHQGAFIRRLERDAADQGTAGRVVAPKKRPSVTRATFSCPD